MRNLFVLAAQPARDLEGNQPAIAPTAKNIGSARPHGSDDLDIFSRHRFNGCWKAPAVDAVRSKNIDRPVAAEIICKRQAIVASAVDAAVEIEERCRRAVGVQGYDRRTAACERFSLGEECRVPRIGFAWRSMRVSGWRKLAIVARLVLHYEETMHFGGEGRDRWRFEQKAQADANAECFAYSRD